MVTLKSPTKRLISRLSPVTEAVLARHLGEFAKKIEAKIDFVRWDFKEHLEAVERRLTLRIIALEQRIEALEQRVEALERRVSSMYEELKCTQMAVREVKSEGLENTKRLQRIEQDHGPRLKRIEEKLERLAA